MKKLKNLNKNIIASFLIFIFLVCGIFSKSFIAGVFFLPIVNNINYASSFSDLVENIIDDIDFYSQNVSYKGSLINLNSIVTKATGVKVVEKTDDTVVKMSNGYLGGPIPKISDEKLDEYANNVTELNNFSKENNIPFLYVMAPQKGYSSDFPHNVDNYLNENCQGFLKRLDNTNVPYLNLFDTLEEKGISEEDAFFVTDHHWKPNIGLMAAKEICKKLNTNYGFCYDSSLLDINNYNIKTYKDWFLGSQGKKVGLYFTDFGADDFDLITPKFETKFTVTQSTDNAPISGSFEETHIVKKNIEEKNHYKLNPYAAYTGGDFSIQIVKNHKAIEDKKILIVRNSFSCVVTPFLSLAAKELHILDIRNLDNIQGERVPSVSSYIEQVNPDYVIVLYQGVPDKGMFYEFDLEE